MLKVFKLKKSGYVSEIDQFLRNFDQQRTVFPASREAERKKHLAIAAKRDTPVQGTESPMWTGF